MLKRFMALPLEVKKDSKGLRTLITELQVTLWWGALFAILPILCYLGTCQALVHSFSHTALNTAQLARAVAYNRCGPYHY